MSATPSETAILLQRWHAGDEPALAAILERNLQWIREVVRRRLGPELKSFAESGDYVHDVVVQVLRTGPRFVVADVNHFRALLAHMVENVLRDRIAWHRAGKRDHRKALGLASDSVVHLDLPAPVTRPSQAAQRNETLAWIHLAMELLAPQDRHLIVWRQHEDLPFAAIGQRLDISENTARMRFQRAVLRLGERVIELRSGRIAAALDAALASARADEPRHGGAKT